MPYEQYDNYERPFEVDAKTERKMSEMHDVADWKKDEIWGENWEEPLEEPKYQEPYPSDSTSTYTNNI